MSIESHVTSLELSKRLKELGVKKESIFYWVKHGLNVVTCEENWQLEILTHNLRSIPDYYIPAYLASELGEILPLFSRAYNQLNIEKTDSGWNVEYSCSREFYKGFVEKYLTNALAKMLIHLLENNLVTLEQVNKTEGAEK